MQIKKLAQRTGVAKSAVRYYESIGLLPKPARRPSGYRNYGEEDVERLQFVAGAGLASFFSPCSFPLLATLLARQTQDVEQSEAWVRPAASSRRPASPSTMERTLLFCQRCWRRAAGDAPEKYLGLIRRIGELNLLPGWRPSS